MHGWAWNLDGKSTACPGFDTGADLMTVELEENGGWMYAPGSTLATAAENNLHMGLDGYELQETNIYEFGCTWLDYINVSVDANHVPFVHPGLSAWIDCSNPEIVYGDGWSTQKAFFKDGSGAPGLAGAWWRTLVERFPNAAGECAWWAHVYPNVVIEHYANLFASVAVVEPTNAGCVIHEDIWVNGKQAEDTELRNAFSEMYPEIEHEDQVITLAQQSGRNLLTSMGLSDSGPYQNPTELGMEHFHQWLLDREADSPSFA
jgi:choline monooxygenase